MNLITYANKGMIFPFIRPQCVLPKKRAKCFENKDILNDG